MALQLSNNWRSEELRARLAERLTAEEVVGMLQDGQTPREILEGAGVDADAFAAGVVSDLEAKLGEAVEAGRIDQAQADEILANADERLENFLNGTFEPGERRGGFGGRGGFPGRGFGPPNGETSPAGVSL